MIAAVDRSGLKTVTIEGPKIYRSQRCSSSIIFILPGGMASEIHFWLQLPGTDNKTLVTYSSTESHMDAAPV